MITLWFSTPNKLVKNSKRALTLSFLPESMKINNEEDLINKNKDLNNSLNKNEEEILIMQGAEAVNLLKN
mgnify:CR=1 FL=1